MKAVEMMRKAIKDSELNGWKWTADKTGLHWEYLDSTFEFFDETMPDESRQVRFKDNDTGVTSLVFVVPESQRWLVDGYHDFETDINEAIYWAARKMISKANYLY